MLIGNENKTIYYLKSDAMFPKLLLVTSHLKILMQCYVATTDLLYFTTLLIPGSVILITNLFILSGQCMCVCVCVCLFVQRGGPGSAYWFIVSNSPPWVSILKGQNHGIL